MPTKADLYGWKPTQKPKEEPKQEPVPAPVEKKIVNIGGEELSPIDNLDVESFAREAAEFYNDPVKFSSFLTNWWYKRKLDNSTQAMTAFNQYLLRLREASASARELQTEILKNKIIFTFQVQIAYQRLKDQWAVEQGGYKHQLSALSAETARHQFLTRFYEQVDPSELSETSLILLSMLTPRSATAYSKNFFGEEQGRQTQYGTAEGILQIKQMEKLLEAVMKEKNLELEERMARIRKENALSRQEEAKADVAETTAKKTKKDYEDIEKT